MKVLFGVHNWGLGHATRDMVLIDKLLSLGHKIDIISTGRSLKILKIRYGKKCKYFNVPDLYPLYTKKRFSNLVFTVHLPDVLKSLRNARKISEKIIKKGNYDKVISDCRMDVYDTNENSYLINHQVRFNVYFLFDKITQKIYSSFMKKYKYVIVPDYENKNLTGKLSHNMTYINKKRIKYIGILSLMKKKRLRMNIDYFISLSGPEVTRRELEKKILIQAGQLKGKVVIAGGNPDKFTTKTFNNITFYSYLDQKKQEDIMNSAKFIIIRAGYTTIMELVELGKKNVLLIPSPNQSEQEYLARLYEKKHWFHRVRQKKLDLKKNIEIAKQFKGYTPKWKTNESVKKFIEIIGA